MQAFFLYLIWFELNGPWLSFYVIKNINIDWLKLYLNLEKSFDIFVIYVMVYDTCMFDSIGYCGVKVTSSRNSRKCKGANDECKENRITFYLKEYLYF